MSGLDSINNAIHIKQGKGESRNANFENTKSVPQGPRKEIYHIIEHYILTP